MDRLSVRELESARDTALARTREADDPQTADMLNRVAAEMTAELGDRYMVMVARAIVGASQDAGKQAMELLNQAMNR